jgi:putative two-component system response regulator
MTSSIWPAHRPRVLSVDDETVTLQLIERILSRGGLDVTAIGSAGAALSAFDAAESAGRPFELVITDIRMPGIDGLAFLDLIRERDHEVPVIVATGHATIDNAIRALKEGASGMIVKPFTAQEFTTEVANALDRARIRHDALQYQFVTPILDGVALALTAAIEARHLETGDHCRQLGVLGQNVAQLMGLPEQDRTTIRIGGYLHDVGKIAIADRILLKPGRLTPMEYEEMKRHSDIGSKIVATHSAMGEIAGIVRHHHERWDGGGYPDGLAGTDIPIGGRIIAVADAFSAMTSDRVYRAALPLEEAWAELKRHSGTQFDADVVALLPRAVELAEEGHGPHAAPAASTQAADSSAA